MTDAWWTGPMLAPSAATLPRGHFLVEPYIFEIGVRGRLDANGARYDAPRANRFGTLTYALYGLSDAVTIGVIPTAGFSNAHVGIGDATLQLQSRISRFREGRWLPATAVVLQETLPTGKYDRLGDRLGDGMGAGTLTTTIGLYSQIYFWLPNGRILRTRLDVSSAFPRHATVDDASVYGTETGFHGRVYPGRSSSVDAAVEYSVTRRWVFALDVVYSRQANTRIVGSPDTDLDLGSNEAFGFAPAVEFSWRPNIGVLIGARVIPSGRNTAVTLTPAVAINYVH